ncbi:alpha/beta fold hydrolase [Solwaraspora sp. WMMB335]|uniref:alpha/beta fold hydrolase n=1 Tax=Solwaraspora sp. WMMB335 TaxID=3404118 RepID=UPI003B93910C
MGSSIYRFGPFELDPTGGQLCRNGQPVRLGSRTLALLCHLVEHRDRPVSSKELLRAVWGDESVTGAAVTTGLYALRSAIGDTGRQQRFIRTFPGRGYRFIASTWALPAGSRDIIQFCRTADGTRIAWAATSSGPPLVKTANWMSRIDLERTTSLFTHWFEGLARGRRYIRYDERGCGLSDQTSGFTLDEWIEDLDAVVDAAGLDRFPLLGVSHGGALAVAYAAHRPHRVSRLVLNAAVARGRLARADEDADTDAADLDLKISLTGWDTHDRSYQRFLSTQFFAGSPPEQGDEFISFLRRSVSADNGARFLEAFSRIDVADLARQVRCPTLVTHSRDDPRNPVSQAMELAELIPDSRLVLFDGRNHLLTAGEPAWPAFLAELDAFLAEEPGSG